MEEYNNISLFDDFDDSLADNLEIVKAKFDDTQKSNWKSLFSGFDKLYAITYSSGLNFINNVINLFEEVEIIFGCERVMSYSAQEVFAFQGKFMEYIRNNISSTKSSLINRIDNGSLHMYVAKHALSHEKIYLLESKTGKKRVITGSANMSYNAFGGTQRENIICFDDDEAFDYYFYIYQSLKIKSVDDITSESIKIGDLNDNIDKLPISKTVKVNKVLEIVPQKENSDEIKFVLDIEKAAKDLETSMPKKDNKTGKITLVPKTINSIKGQRISDVEKQKESLQEYPKLLIDTEESKLILNEKEIDLNPHKDEIINDLNLFHEYMEGFNKFHGNNKEMQFRYFELANWFFCSPFMAIMRDTAIRHDHITLLYPVFGLVYGQSKAGKTSFLETLEKMMIGQKPKMAAPDFTRSSIESLKRTVQGAPIIVDDLTKLRFNQHAIETIKNDDFGVADKLFNYPAVVISANEDLKAVPQEIARRTVIFHVTAGLTNTEMMESNIVRNVQKKIGTAFYREYIRRMLEVVPDLINQLKEETNIKPDILQVSSQIIVQIFKDYNLSMPQYIRELSIKDYFGEKVTGAHAVKVITESWNSDKSLFEVNKKKNTLTYNALQTYEADRIIMQLPETLEARRVGDKVSMKYDEACKYFDIKFNKYFWNK